MFRIRFHGRGGRYRPEYFDGNGRVLHSEFATALYGTTGAPILASYIGGLGGRDISQQEFFAIAEIQARVDSYWDKVGPK